MMNQQENKNSLPKYWVVQCNTKNPNWKKVIDYLKNVHGEKWGGDIDGDYYGYDGGSCWKGTNVFNDITSFQNSPVVLTIEEFVEMTEGFVLPEKWCIKRDKENDKIVTDFINNYSESNHCYLDYNPKNPYLHYTKKSVSSNDKPWDNYTEITFEQFKKHVLKTEETTKTITHTQAQSIIDIACATWKDKLFTKWGREIVLKESIGISEEFYQTMRKACTSEQHQLFDEIFGKDVKFKVGDWVTYWSESEQKTLTSKIVKATASSYCVLENGKEPFYDLLKHATEKEIQKAKYKIGDWVYIGEVSHRWNSIVQLTKDSDKDFGYAKTKQGDESWFDVRFIERHATEEEIQKAQYIPKGTPCLVRDSNNDMWKLTYSLGNGKFQSRSGVELSWVQVQVLDMNNLPKY